MDRFRMFDAPRRPQVTTITFEMRTERDDSADAPDQMSDGFWPSRDPQAAGYVLPENYEAEHAKAKARMDGWENDDWHYCGVFARATINVAIGAGSFTVYQVDSPGVWGIESDAADYLKEVFTEECETLLDHLGIAGDVAKAELAKIKAATAKAGA